MIEEFMSQDEMQGEVRGFRQWTENKKSKLTNEESQEHVWTFQLERHQAGQHLPPIPVEMRGQSFTGVLSEGHIVSLLRSTWREGEVVRTDRVYNVTLQAPVLAQKEGLPWFRIIVAILLVLLFLAFVVWGIWRVNS
jgi:hypothetical protein